MSSDSTGSAILPWTVSASETLLDTPFVTVVADTCHPSEETTLRYFSLRFVDWVNVVAVTDALDLIVVRQYRHAARSITLEIPAGAVSPGEDPAVTAGRELLEETGFQAGRVTPIARRQVNPALQNNELHTFLAESCRRVQAPDTSAAEHTETVLLPREEWVPPGAPGRPRHAFSALAICDALGHLGL